MAFEYHIAAVTLWMQIVSAPYLYNPISYLLRHTIELQLKGLIVCELRKDNSFLKISEIKTPVGKMNTVHSVKALWKYYQQLCQEHKLQMDVILTVSSVCEFSQRLTKKTFHPPTIDILFQKRIRLSLLNRSKSVLMIKLRI